MSRRLHMAALTTKQKRTLERNIDELYSRTSIVANPSMEDYRDPNLELKMLRLADNRHLLLTSSGFQKLRRIAETLYDADLFDGKAEYQEISTACREVFQSLLSKDLRPDDAIEYVALVQELVRNSICVRTFATPLFGVKLDGIDSLQMGRFFIVDSPRRFIDDAGITCDRGLLQHHFSAAKELDWLMGKSEGTPEAASSRFRTSADLMTGLLALIAAANYEGGAVGFRIGMRMIPDQGNNDALSISWNEIRDELTMCRSFPKSQPLLLGSDFPGELLPIPLLNRALSIIDSPARNQFDATIAKAIFWFADANRELIPVMQLIKFWSCIEAFFSSSRSGITESIKARLATLLTSQRYGRLNYPDYAVLKERIGHLYNLRSRALHQARHENVLSRHVGDISQWAAWMLISFLAMSCDGFSTLEELAKWADTHDRDRTRATRNPWISQVTKLWARVCAKVDRARPRQNPSHGVGRR